MNKACNYEVINKIIIIFGAGVEGKKTLERLGRDKVQFFADNNKELHGKYIQSKRVLSLEELIDLYNSCECIVIISSQKYYYEIETQLKLIGVENIVSTSMFLIEEAFYKKSGKRIILMNTHAGINIGDQLITEAEYLFFESYLPEYNIVEIPADLIDENIYAIKKKILKDDYIAISGGGYMGSLWLEYGEENVRTIIDNFPNNHIIILPQSIFFEKTISGQNEYDISAKTYNKHSNLIICARERNTYDTAINMINDKEKIQFFPDMVTLFNVSCVNRERHNVGICLRTDKERVLSNSSYEKIQSYISNEVILFDMLANDYICSYERKKAVASMVEKVSGFKYVITDRLHCMLLCAITGTPCIAFDNLTKKVSGVYEWIKNNHYIHVLNDINQIGQLLDYYENNIVNYSYDREMVLPYFSKLASLFTV